MPAKSTQTAKAAAAAAPNRPPKKGDHVFLVDGSGFIFRAYHALPPLTRKSDGLPVDAVLGFCNMLWKLLRDMKPERTADPPGGDLRQVRAAPSATRSIPTTRPTGRSRPRTCVPQFPLIREAVRAFDIPCLEQAGFEADDLIATYVRAGLRGAAPPRPSCRPTRT